MSMAPRKSCGTRVPEAFVELAPCYSRLFAKAFTRDANFARCC